MKIVDANYVLRYLLQDVPEQFETAKQIMENSRVFLPFEVIAEVVYVLQGVYDIKKEEICNSLSTLLSYPNIKTTDKEVAETALKRFKAHKLDFVYALLAGYAGEHSHEVLTFDKKLQKILNS